LRQAGERSFEANDTGQHVLLRHDDVVEEQAAGDRRAQTHLVLDRLRGETLEALLDEKAANAFIGLRPHDGEIGNRTVRDPHLGSVQHPIGAASLRTRLHVGGIRSAVRLREPKARDHLPLCHARQPALFLFLTAEGVDRIHAEARLHGNETAYSGIAALELLADQAIRQRIQPGTAVAFNRATQQTELCDAADELTRKAFVLEAVANDRNHLFIDELRDGVLHHPFVLR
jgi:hypothetical protein